MQTLSLPGEAELRDTARISLIGFVLSSLLLVGWLMYFQVVSAVNLFLVLLQTKSVACQHQYGSRPVLYFCPDPIFFAGTIIRYITTVQVHLDDIACPCDTIFGTDFRQGKLTSASSNKAVRRAKIKNKREEKLSMYNISNANIEFLNAEFEMLSMYRLCRCNSTQ